MPNPGVLTVLLLALVLGACAAPGSQAGNPADVSSRFNGFFRCSEASELMNYAQRIRAMGNEELLAEYTATSQSLARQKSDGTRLRLALLLSLPGATFHDDARAAALADEVAGRKNPENNSLRPLALMISTAASERQKLAQRLQEEGKRGDALQQKLDELKAIEKNLMNREPTKPVKVK